MYIENIVTLNVDKNFKIFKGLAIFIHTWNKKLIFGPFFYSYLEFNAS